MQIPLPLLASVLALLAATGCDNASKAIPLEEPPGPLGPLALTTTPYQPDSGFVAIHCGTLIDGVADQPMKDVTVVIRRGRVAAIEKGRTQPPNIPLLDLADYTCLPGLIDMHTHVTETSTDTSDPKVYLTRTPEETAEISNRQAGETLLAGFTTIRNVGVYLSWSDRDLRDAINRGQTSGPRMQVSGFYLTIPHGGGDLIIPGIKESDIPYFFRAGIARGPDEFRRRAQEAIAGGADVLKVIASGAVLAYGGVPGDPEMKPAEIEAVVKVAHEAHRKVAAHAHGARSIKEAILAGADTIEHASLIDDEGIQLAKTRNVALAMDVYNGDYIDTEGRKQGWPEEFLRKNVETTEAQRQAFTRAHKAGVPIVFATDAGVFPHGLNARQFPIMVQRGMTPMEAVKSATSLAAKYMGWGDAVGQLTPGYLGDLIAVKGDPLKDISTLENVQAVIKGGLAFKLPTKK